MDDRIFEDIASCQIIKAMYTCVVSSYMYHLFLHLFVYLLTYLFIYLLLNLLM